jgi:ribose-phosphate pyrophosphokinase
MIKIFPQSNSLEFTEQLVKCNAGYELGKIHKTKFANGEITVVIEESVRNEAIVVVSQARTYEDMFELFETIDAARRSSAKEIIGIIPYLPHSRQERREEGVRTTISARLFADMLQTAGLDRLITMDVHTTAIEGFYKIPFDNLDPFTIIIDKIKNLGLVNPTIVSPDLGGMKRAEKYASALGYNIAFINKKRLKANEVDKMTLIGSVKDSDVIIVDDMVDTANTLIAAANLLKNNGALRIITIATHGIFSGNALEKINNSIIDELYITNTLNYDFNFKIKKLDISTIIYNNLKKNISL